MGTVVGVVVEAVVVVAVGAVVGVTVEAVVLVTVGTVPGWCHGGGGGRCGSGLCGR